MFHHHIDSTLNVPVDGSDLLIEGWCFANHAAVDDVRVSSDGWSAPAEYGRARDDVAKAWPDAPQALKSGFRIVTPPPAGVRHLTLQALVDQTWHNIAELHLIPAAMEPLQGSFDTPTDPVVEAGTVRFSGWCCHPQQEIVRLKLHLLGQTHECNHKIARADVGDAYPNWPGSEASGFEVSPQLTPGSSKVTLSAVLADGTELDLEGFQKFRVKAPSPTARIARRWRQVSGLTTHMVQLAEARKRRVGRHPRLHEIPFLVREAITVLNRYRARDKAQDHNLPAGFQLPQPMDPYQAWLSVNSFGPRAEKHLQQRLRSLKSKPLLSLIVPVYNPPMAFFEKLLATIDSQIYTHWELCIADDCSPDKAVRPFLEQLAARESRVRLTFREENGNISAATNSAAAMASGEFLVFVDQDDELTPDALAEIALYLDAHSQTDVLYTDDDKISETGMRFDPQFKPDWSPELLLSYMYFSHIFCVRRELFQAVGGARLGYEGSQDYDLALRVTERARHVGHIPRILYHWRVLPGSTAMAADAKPESMNAGLKAVRSAAQRRKWCADFVQPEWAQKANVGIFAPDFPDDGPKVSILIPTKNGLELLKGCIDSLATTTYRNYEVIIIDNDSDDPATLTYMAALPHRVERISNPGPRFSFAHINNRAAERVDGDYLLFLNNDTEVLEPTWLNRMVGYAQIDGVGAVGARLLFPDGRIQHAGIVHGLYQGLAGPAFKLQPNWHNGYLSYAAVGRNFSAVTAACMLTPRQLFLDTGMFNEPDYAVAFNDVDYCYRLVDKGLRCVYVPGAELRHHEGYTRGFADNPAETAHFKRTNSQRRDAFYNPNLSLSHERFEITPRRLVSGDTPPIPALMCAFNLNWEGAPYSQYEMTVHLKDSGVLAPTVYCPQEGPLREAYESQGIPVHVFEHPLANVNTDEAYETAMNRFTQKVEAWGVELIYGNTLQTFYAMDAAHRLGLPCVWNPRESEPWQSYFNFLPEPVAARALQCFPYPYKVVFVAEATKTGFEDLNTAHNFHVIHNGLDPERLRANASRFPRQQARQKLEVGDNEIVLLLLGTVCERKGQKDLAEAMGKLETDQAVRCFIVGDRPGLYSEQLHQIRDSLPQEIAQRVRIVGETPDTSLYYSAADIFVCTSRVESFPRVILEAMAHDLPIVTTPVFGIVEQVQEHINANFYAPGDSAGLAKALTQLIQDNDLRAKYAANARHVLAILNDFEDMTRGYAEVFREAWLSGGR